MGTVLRIGLVSDSHGNGIGLDAALAGLRRQGVDAIVAMGDMVQGGSQPTRVLERLHDLGCPVVMGNSDSFVLTGESREPATPAHHEVREWTREKIGPDGLAFVETFQPTVEVPLEAGRTLLCFHGSPRDFDEVLLPETPDDAFEEALDGARADVYAGGHVHLQWSRSLGSGLFVSVGSVGLVYDRHVEQTDHRLLPIAEYAVVVSDGPSVSVEMCRALLDPDELVRAARASGRPHAENEAKLYGG